ncbi:MAG: hypothetical protein DRR42_20995 [Gammaproteobacteria bacterium]|nr:MAG: hypothetical protein DRR42_20995 [Gammaproteobacteria bacterium]
MKKIQGRILSFLNFQMRALGVIVVASSLFLAQPLAAAQIDFFGTSQNSVSTAIPWVAGSTMWGHLDVAGGAGQSTTGFTSLGGKDISKLGFSFGDLDLTSWLSPGPASAGYEIYTDDGTGTPLEFSYDGDLWATGTVHFLRTDVANSSDLNATALMSVTLLSAGLDDAFFNEIMSLTGGTGMITLNAHSFTPINASGLFSAVTTLELTAVPVPAAVWLFGSALGFLGWIRRKTI